MPYRYVEPDLYLSYQGVEIFHTYRDGQDFVRDYWFTTDPAHADGGYAHGAGGIFDVRRFTRLANSDNVSVWEGWWKPRFAAEGDAIRALILAEIEAGRLPISEGER